MDEIKTHHYHIGIGRYFQSNVNLMIMKIGKTDIKPLEYVTIEYESQFIVVQDKKDGDLNFFQGLAQANSLNTLQVGPYGQPGKAPGMAKPKNLKDLKPRLF